MYIPKHFEETSVDVMHDLMRAHSLATLVTLSSEGLNANHIPLHISAGATAHGSLKGHVARANPILHDLISDVEVLAIFQGPAHYISPSLYATKAENGLVVPTWNYAVVHAYGKLEIRDDPLWIREQMEALTREQERGYDKPWSVSDAPADYTAKLIGAVVGIEITITRLEGKWKVSQNQPARNRESVIKGLSDTRGESVNLMAQLVKARSPRTL